MKDVAVAAGVSISTVSRVVCRKAIVDETTAARVREVIRELNYRPNLVASGLRSKSGRAVGLLVPRIRDPFFAALIDCVDREVVSRGYNLLLFNTRSDPVLEEEMISNLLRRHVDGIIYSMISDESWALDLVTNVDVPVVMLDRVRHASGVLSVVVDNRKAGRIAADHLAGLGHRRIACVTGSPKVHLSVERLGGFRERLTEVGLRLADRHVIEGDFTFASGVVAGKALAQSRNRVTAVWVHNDMMAAGVLRGLSHMSVTVPDEMSVIGMDDLEIAEMSDPPLTTIAQPVEQMGQLAVSVILDKLDSHSGQTTFELEPSLVVRLSTGRCSSG